MKRKILLIEPNYKNKYPPIGLMKISTYHKMLKDEVTFYKGEFTDFILEEIYEDLISQLMINDIETNWIKLKKNIINYIKKGSKQELEKIKSETNSVLALENIKYFRNYYKKKLYFENPKWDRIYITTLFTFYWKETVETINLYKKLCKDIKEVKVGGVAASVVPLEIEKETQIKPFVGLLDKGGEYDSDNKIIIDHLPLDYSILEEIEYIYPEQDGYYGYMTRGCINKCPFCAVPKIEPHYTNFISIKKQINITKEKFGEKKNLLLLDNNVLASNKFFEIIDEIKECGFDKQQKYIETNKYEIIINGLKSGYNDRGYKKSLLKEYKKLIGKERNEKVKNEMYKLLKINNLCDVYTMQLENILKVHDYFSIFFKKIYSKKYKKRYVDFNQGVDARILSRNPEKVKKLAEIPIKPLRIAFDSWSLKEDYEKAIRLATEYGIKEMSNYLLYNYDDFPIELYNRLKMNVELCEELKVNIYSFPMKFHPIDDSEYFRNRDYIGKNWNRKFIRAIQAILNSTKGKIGKGKSFFEEAFGKNEQEFEKLLYMPEALIIYRNHFKDNGITEKWWQNFSDLSFEEKNIAKNIIHENNFINLNEKTNNHKILEVLEYYNIKRLIK